MSWQLFHFAPSKYITQNYYFPNNVHKKGTPVRGKQFCEVTAEHKRYVLVIALKTRKHAVVKLLHHSMFD